MPAAQSLQALMKGMVVSMVDKPFLFSLAKIAALIATVFLAYSNGVDITFTVISALSLVCVFLLELLISRTIKSNKIIIFTVAASIIACFFLGLDTFYPLYLILLIHILDLTIVSNLFYQILIVSVLLSLFIFPPDIITLALSAILIIMLLFCRILLAKLNFYIEKSESCMETISELNKKLTDLKSLTKTLKYTASVEERNRIAARIHDQIGHGISGSIIMLEAAMLTMKNNPDKASESIQKAVTNLRDGVDEIRTALKEERAGREILGKNDITAMLEEFKFSYNVQTYLKTSGELDNISIDLWACIHDNLKECLTNVLKHSNATEFHLSIDVFKKIIKVEYKDNGKSAETFTKGLGLEAIEERTVGVKGRCFFTKGGNGFCITNIFTY